jgi:hypothetical protein
MKLEDLDVVTYEILESTIMQCAYFKQKLMQIKMDISTAQMVYQRNGAERALHIISSLTSEFAMYNSQLKEIGQNFMNICSNMGYDYIDVLRCFNAKYPSLALMSRK